MNAVAILSLISELYAQVTALSEENRNLKELLGEAKSPDPS